MMKSKLRTKRKSTPKHTLCTVLEAVGELKLAARGDMGAGILVNPLEVDSSC